jgi:hydrogenase-4 component B
MQTNLFLAGLILYPAITIAALATSSKAKMFFRQTILWLILLANLMFLVFSVITFISGRTFYITPYQLTASLQFDFAVDRLGAFFMGTTSLVAVSVSCYSLRYVEHSGTDAGKNVMAAITSLFILSMLLVIASANTFSFLFWWEIMSIASFFLVMHERDKSETRKSALFYLIMTQMSTVFLMFGFLAIYAVTGSFNIQPVSGISLPLASAIFLSLFIGFIIKAGVMPFHKWLPYAHSASPSNISALMSGVMIKVAIYGIVRYLMIVFSPVWWWGLIILVFGTFSALLGVIYALKEHDLKKLLAYHSIENIGIILIGIGLYAIFRSNGLQDLATLSLLGGLFHTFNHAMFKSLLFLTAGSVVNATGTRNIEEMGGLLKTMPYTGVLFLVGSVAIAALPPLNGFVSELMIFQSFLQSFTVVGPLLKIVMFAGLALFALTSALAAACFVKAFGIVFLAMPRSEAARKATEVSPYMLFGSAILAVCCIFSGIFSYQIFMALGYNLAIPDMMLIGLLLFIALITVWLAVRVFANRKTRISETWGCGLTSQNSRMEYTASGFSEPILTIFRPVYRTNKWSERWFFDAGNSLFKNGHAAIRTFKLFEEKIYLPVARFVQRFSLYVANLQDVDLDTYILYSFIAIIVLVLTMGWLV